MTRKLLNIAHSVVMAFACVFLGVLNGLAYAGPSLNPVQADVKAACELVETRYVYFDALMMDVSSFCDDLTAGAADKTNSVPVLEELVAALRDSHISLDTNTSRSLRLAPSGSDYAVRPLGDGLAVITGVRPASSAAHAGLDPGDQVIAIDGQPIDAIMASWDAYDTGDQPLNREISALNQAAAGRRGKPRTISLKNEQGTRQIRLEDPIYPQNRAPVSSQLLPGGTLYIRFNNSLGDIETVAAFDAAVKEHETTRHWIIDLRDTPSGGDTDVAEPILGRFVDKRANYQRYGTDETGYTDRYVDPRGPWTISGDIIVLVGNWTGSMGEGMAVGFDALGVADVIGSPMAALRGGIENMELPSGLNLRLPTYDLTHMDGTPRHDWIPPHKQIADNGNGPDIALAHAVWMLTQKGD